MNSEPKTKKGNKVQSARKPGTAKQKLNGAYITGSFIVSGLAGMATDSPVVFVIALIVMLFSGYHDGSLRT